MIDKDDLSLNNSIDQTISKTYLGLRNSMFGLVMSITPAG